MARIFTTQFKYNHQHYDAIVTVIPKDGVTTFNVKVLDLDLHELLPGGEFSYVDVDGLKTHDTVKNVVTLTLMHSISIAIEEHLASIS